MYLMPPPDTLNPVVDLEIDSYGRIWTGIYVGYLSEGGVLCGMVINGLIMIIMLMD